MASIRYNRVFLTLVTVAAIAIGTQIAVASTGNPWRFVGILLAALGFAVPFWVSIGQHKDRRRRLVNLAETASSSAELLQNQIGEVRTVQAAQLEVQSLIHRVASLEDQLIGVEASVGSAHQELKMRIRQLSRGLIELARHQDAARDELMTLERLLRKTLNESEVTTL